MEAETSILLADSDRISVELGKAYLKNTGAKIYSCHDGDMAWEIARSERPDLVFLSASLPGLDGLACCRLIKADDTLRTTRVVLTLLSGDGENIELCWKAGCDDILLKPVDRKTFFATVKRFVDLEKRISPRFKARFHIRCHGLAEDPDICNVFDVSTGGLFLQASPLLDVNRVVELDFVLPVQNVEVNCKGRVAWINFPEEPAKAAFPPGMGIEFVELSPEGRQAIHDYLQKEHVTRIHKSFKP